MTEFRYITWPEYGVLTESLAEKVRAGGKEFDLIVGVARGGIPVAMVVSDRLRVELDYINVKSYTGIAERSSPKVISTLTESIKGRSVLLVDDLVDHGVTLAMLKQFLLGQLPGILQTAVLIRKPWSQTTPDYYLETDDRWIVFPFEHGEVEEQKARLDSGSEREK